jgi:hypothetical protein
MAYADLDWMALEEVLEEDESEEEGEQPPAESAD